MPATNLSAKLFENGIDFIQQSFKDFEEGRYKYSVIHFSSGIEVLLKAIITTEDWQLIVTKPTYSFTDLMDGTAKTIQIGDSIKIIQNDLNFIMRDRGEKFKNVANERNKAIHAFPNVNDQDILALHYQAFEELWFFFQKYPTITDFAGKELKAIAIRLGNLIRRTKGNTIDAFFNGLDAKRDYLLRRIELVDSYKKSVSKRIYTQEITFRDKNGEPYPEWEVKPLRKLCKFSLRKDGLSNAIPLRISANGQLKLDIEDNSKGMIIGWITTSAQIELGFLSIVIEMSQPYFWRIRQGTVFVRLRPVDIYDLNVSLPCSDEQLKIVEFIEQLDKKIMILRKQLNIYSLFEQEIKKKMFV